MKDLRKILKHLENIYIWYVETAKENSALCFWSLPEKSVDDLSFLSTCMFPGKNFKLHKLSHEMHQLMNFHCGLDSWLINARTDAFRQFYSWGVWAALHKLKTWRSPYFHLPVVKITFISLLFGVRELCAFWFMLNITKVWLFICRMVQRNACPSRHLHAVCSRSRVLFSFYICHTVYGSMAKGFHPYDCASHTS